MSEHVEIIIATLLFFWLAYRSYLNSKGKTIVGSDGKTQSLLNDSVMEIIVEKLFSGSFSVLVTLALNVFIFSAGCLWLVAKGKLDAKIIDTIFTAMVVLLSNCWKDYLGKPTETKTTNGGATNGTSTKIDNGSSPVINGKPGNIGESGSPQNK